jgi:vacuolar-type H+-ATPase subunit E/Vma4
MDNLEKLTGRIISDAEEFARGLLESAESNIAEINDATQSNIDYIKRDFASRAEKEEKAILDRAEAAADSISRDYMLSAKAALLDSVFDTVKERLQKLAISGSEEYIGLLADLLCKVILSEAQSETANADYYRSGELTLNTGYIASFCARDLAGGDHSVAETAIAKAAQDLSGIGKTLKVSDVPADIDGGFILRSGNIEYNCSLTALVAGYRAAHEGEIYRYMFEQPELKHEKEI